MSVPAVAADTGWQRLHPLTPLLRAGRGLFLAAVLVSQYLITAAPALVSAGVLAAAVPVVLLYGYLSWRFTRWRLVEQDLRVETGVLFRQSRQVPLARLQAVDLVRGLAARALGLAELRLEVVGGGESEGRLAYLSTGEADRVRALLLSAAREAEAPRPGSATTGGATTATDDGGVAGAGTGGDEAATDVAEHTLVVVPTGALLTSIALSSSTVLGAVGLLAVAVAAVVLVAVDGAVVLPALIPVVLGIGATVVGGVLRDLQRGYGFTLTSGRDGLRLSHGLLETRSQTVPAGRVQAVRLVEPLLWRRRGWARVEVDVAGYGGADAQAATATLLPVGPSDYARVLAGVAVPGLDVDAVPRARTPRRARWLAPLEWPRLAVGAGEDHLVTSSGWVTSRLVGVPWVKVQSVRLVAGPLQRRLGLATLHVDTAGRFVRAQAPHRDAGEAREMLDDVALRARRARTVDLRGGTVERPPRARDPSPAAPRPAAPGPHLHTPTPPETRPEPPA